MMLLQESDKVNKTLDVETNEILMNYLMGQGREICNISKDVEQT